MADNDQEYPEEDIQSTIKYLKINDPENATREGAIKFLRGMHATSHMIAHDIVKKEIEEKIKK